MKSVNVADLKNNLSAYLEQVEKGEQVVVRNRKRPVARIVPVRLSGLNEEERQLVLDGDLQLPEKDMSKHFLDQVLSWKLPAVTRGTSLEAVMADRNRD